MQHMVKTCEVCGHEPMTHMSIYQRIHLLVKVMLNVIPWWWLSPSKSPKIVVQSEVLSSGKINPYPKCVCIPGEDKALYPQWWDGLNIINWLPNDWEDLWGMCHTGAPQLYLLCDTDEVLLQSYHGGLLVLHTYFNCRLITCLFSPKCANWGHGKPGNSKIFIITIVVTVM